MIDKQVYLWSPTKSRGVRKKDNSNSIPTIIDSSKGIAFRKKVETKYVTFDKISLAYLIIVD